MDKFNSLPVDKQYRIIDAALLSFGTNGYKKTSASDIAAAAGISKAMIFHYFGTKKDLYLYLINYCYDMIEKEMNDKFDNSVTDFFDRIMLSSQIEMSVMNQHPATVAFLASVYYEVDDEVKDDIRVIFSRSEDMQNRIVYEGIDISKFKEGIDPHTVMKILLWMADGFANSVKLKGFTKDNLEALIGEYFECMNLLKKHFYKEDNLK